MVFNIDQIGTATGRTRLRLTTLLLAGGALLWPLSSIRAETLMDAVEAAYATNPTLEAQRHRQKSTNESYVQARSQYGPQLQLSASARHDYTELRGREVEGDTGQATLNLNQPVYTGGRLRGGLAQARANVSSSQETLRRVEGEVILDVISAYANVIRDRGRVEVSRQNVVALRGQLDERRAKRRVRDATITDVAQADARLAAGESQLATAEAQLAITEGQYLALVGREPGDLQPLPDLPGLPASIDDAFAVAEVENANVGSARFNEEASRANIAIQRGAQRPTATITAEAGRVGDLSTLDQRNYQTQATARITITQPLFQAGAIRSRIRQAQNLNRASQATLDFARRDALQDVVIAWSGLSAARVAVVSGTRQVEAAQIAYAGMQREEQFGLRSTIEVLNAEQELASSQLTLLGNRSQEYVARASLLLAMGRLDARTVNSAIPAKDPDAEFKKVRWRGMLITEPAVMLIDRIGSASPYAKPKPDLRNPNPPKPTSSTTLPPVPSKAHTDQPLVPIDASKLVPADQLPAIVGDYGTPPPRAEDPR